LIVNELTGITGCAHISTPGFAKDIYGMINVMCELIIKKAVLSGSGSSQSRESLSMTDVYLIG
jgi:hypothetical protein